MYAIIKTGGKQYTVRPGDVVQVEKLDKNLGAEFDISEVLMVGGETTHIGQPTVKNASVTVVVTKQARTRKLFVFKKKRRHSYRKFKTHRQEFTEIFVKSIKSPDGKVASAETEPKIVDVNKVREERLKSKAEAAKSRAKLGDEAMEKAAAAKTKKATKPAARKKVSTKKTNKSAKKTAAGKKSTKKS